MSFKIYVNFYQDGFTDSLIHVLWIFALVDFFGLKFVKY